MFVLSLITKEIVKYVSKDALPRLLENCLSVCGMDCGARVFCTVKKAGVLLWKQPLTRLWKRESVDLKENKMANFQGIDLQC